LWMGICMVHQLPVIRDALLQVLSERYPDNMPWLRNTQPGKLSNGLPWMQRLKARVIGALGARTLSRSAQQIGAKLNRDFLVPMIFHARIHRMLRCLMPGYSRQAMVPC